MSDKQPKTKSITKYFGIPIFILLAIIIVAILIPEYLSMQEYRWYHNKPSKMFYELTKELAVNKQGIELTENYKRELSDHYYKLFKVYGPDKAKDIYFATIADVLKNELLKYKERVDTFQVMVKIKHAIDDKLSSAEP